MAKASRIRADLQSAGRGGHVVAVGDDVVSSLGLKQHSRVKGTIGGTPYRSSTARYGGVMYLGVHKATVKDAGLAVGDSVDVTIELDPEPREIDIPPDLARASRPTRRRRPHGMRCRRATNGRTRKPSLMRNGRRPGPAGSRGRSMWCSGSRSGPGCAL